MPIIKMLAEEGKGQATTMPGMVMSKTVKPGKTIGPEEQQTPAGELHFRDTREPAT
jgi:hypothetical protein